MRRSATVVVWIAAIAAATMLFYAAEHELSTAFFMSGVRPEIREALQQSLADQKRLRTLDPQNSAAYKRRFDDIHRLSRRIDVLQLSRVELLRRYEYALAGVFAALLLLASIVAWTRQRRTERRLAGIRTGLEALSRGETRIAIGDQRRDVIGRIAEMIEQTASVVSRQRRRIDSLQHLSAWQEAARRHAHEIRTPVTAARLEVERLASLAAERPHAQEIEKVKESALEELDRLARYTTEFSSFAKLPQPVRRRESMAALVDEFCRAFANAWPDLSLRVSNGADAHALADRDMVRQVFANLCSNSSAAAGGRGTVTFSIGRQNGNVVVDVADDGKGIDSSIRARLFEPYVTTRGPGHGMGLGLAISRKIMLDHDGELELVDSTPAGTTFRLLFPAAEELR